MISLTMMMNSLAAVRIIKTMEWGDMAAVRIIKTMEWGDMAAVRIIKTMEWADMAAVRIIKTMEWMEMKIKVAWGWVDMEDMDMEDVKSGFKIKKIQQITCVSGYWQ